MVPSKIIIVQVWGTSILNMTHRHMWVPHLTPRSLMLLISHFPCSYLMGKDGHLCCQFRERIHCDLILKKIIIKKIKSKIDKKGN